MVLFIDLVLIKPQVSKFLPMNPSISPFYGEDSTASIMHADSVQVYRHLLFNLLGREDGRFDVSIDVPRYPFAITKLAPALCHPPRHPTPPLRRLPNMGSH